MDFLKCVKLCTHIDIDSVTYILPEWQKSKMADKMVK